MVEQPAMPHPSEHPRCPPVLADSPPVLADSPPVLADSPPVLADSQQSDGGNSASDLGPSQLPAQYTHTADMADW